MPCDSREACYRSQSTRRKANLSYSADVVFWVYLPLLWQQSCWYIDASFIISKRSHLIVFVPLQNELKTFLTQLFRGSELYGKLQWFIWRYRIRSRWRCGRLTWLTISYILARKGSCFHHRIQILWYSVPSMWSVLIINLSSTNLNCALRVPYHISEK